MKASNATIEKCPHCGASMKKFWHRLTPILVKSLVQFRAKVVEKNQNKIHLQKDLNLTKNQYNNFQKLRYHGMVAHYKKDGKRVAGCWLITRRGADFLNNQIRVPAAVLTFRNQVNDHDDRLVNVTEVIGSTPYLEKIEDITFEMATDSDLPQPVKNTKIVIVFDDTTMTAKEIEVPIDAKVDAKQGVLL